MEADQIKLDKTTDGKFWTITAVVDDDTLIRLRVEHTSAMEPSQVWPEVGVRRSADGPIDWTPAGPDFMFALASPDYEPENWASNFPHVWRQDFVELGRRLGELSRPWPGARHAATLDS